MRHKRIVNAVRRAGKTAMIALGKRTIGTKVHMVCLPIRKGLLRSALLWRDIATVLGVPGVVLASGNEGVSYAVPLSLFAYQDRSYGSAESFCCSANGKQFCQLRWELVRSVARLLRGASGWGLRPDYHRSYGGTSRCEGRSLEALPL